MRSCQATPIPHKCTEGKGMGGSRRMWRMVCFHCLNVACLGGGASAKVANQLDHHSLACCGRVAADYTSLIDELSQLFVTNNGAAWHVWPCGSAYLSVGTHAHPLGSTHRYAWAGSRFCVVPPARLNAVASVACMVARSRARVRVVLAIHLTCSVIVCGLSSSD
jgi:hypothetical protein